ncbi:hypothetical protein RLOC_00000750 [Lonchura striata]|uniref:Uncharacterized protein n=1 Tax=Lonchura striata TaxID=40157 RepID=A0A218UNK3_9PASE|nr:hypothetical protein RLOC_00000750 [Lonchura striata domestica]
MVLSSYAGILMVRDQERWQEHLSYGRQNRNTPCT